MSGADAGKEVPRIAVPEGAVQREAVPRCLACGGTERAPEAEVRAQMMATREHRAPFTFVRCTGCGLVFLDPRIPQDALGAFYTGAYLPYRGPRAWGPFAPVVAAGLWRQDRKRVALVRRHAEVGPGTRVLDVGCGKPSFLESLRRATGCAAVGTDFSDSGWRDDPGRWRELDLRVGDIHELHLDAHSDVITMWHYLEHDYAPAKTLERIRELAAGTHARLFVEVPDHDSWTRRRHGALWAGYHAPRHTALYDPDSITTLLERSGWSVVEILRRGSLDPFVLHWMSRMEARGIDWSESMASRAPGFLAGKVAWGVRFRRRRDGLGVLTAVARPQA
jgi:SAM-dependent methyltransferase